MSKHHRSHPAREPQGLPVLATLSPTMQDVLAIVFLYAVTLVLFRGIVFDNAAFAAGGDTAAEQSYAHAGAELEQKEGVDVLWMPYFFSGLPTFGNVAFLPHHVSYLQNVMQAALNLLFLNGTWTWLVVYYFLGGACMFLLMRTWKFSRAASLLAALTFMLSPYMVGLAGEGHGTKLMALCYLPLVVLLTHQLFERRDLLSFGLLAAAIGTLMLTDHMQIVYYEFVFCALFLIYHVSGDIPGHPRLALLKGALFAAALILGFCIASYIYLSVYEYAQYSMRGGGTTGASGGLGYDYATNWSWHPAELITLLVPGFFGMKAEYYWGPMIPWTNSSVYVGLAPILFGGIALAYRRSRLVLFFGVTALLLVLTSFGNNFSLLYRPLFAFLPFFNKFRSPEQILHLLPFTTGVLAAAGFTALEEAAAGGSRIPAQRLARTLFIAGGVLGGLFLLAILLQGSMLDSLPSSWFITEGQLQQITRQYAARAARAVAQIRETRFDVFYRDLVKFLVLGAAFCGLAGAFLAGKMRGWSFAAVVLLLGTLDLSLVDAKYIDPQPRESMMQEFKPDETKTFLLHQPGLFRVFAGIDPSDPLYMDNSFAYHGIQSITGYSPAKLRIYQTLLDSCMYRSTDPTFPINMHVVDMLNVEYMVTRFRLPEPRFQLVNVDQAERVLTYRNPGALPRAFFVREALVAAGDGEVFRALNAPDFDPARTAVLSGALAARIAPVDSAHAPQVTSYKSREIRIRTDAPDTALLVLSEIYYPAGWKATVDGSESPIYRTDYVLRSVVVPPGSHEVIFTFDPPLYRTGWLLTNAAWGLVLVCVAGGLWRLPSLRSRRDAPAAKEP